MENKNCEQLFEYLRCILYEPAGADVHPEMVDAPFQKLALGLQYLNQAVQEMKAYSAALSNGNLSVQPPDRENFLCENLKNIHANLNHLTWQAKQVAKGDYSQTVSYLGEFSEAFNTMTRLLREREQSLKNEAQMQKKHAAMVVNYNQLLLNLIERSQEDILVTSIDRPQIFYCSKNNIKEIQNYELYQIFLEKQKKGELLTPDSDPAHKWTWEAEDSTHRFYRIMTSQMEWRGEQAYAHIILEITEEKLEQDKLELEAHFDRLTQIGNRYYFHKKMHELLRSNEAFVFCYCDLDHLKYVNDTFGHREGDWYLCHFVEMAKKQIRMGDIFARVGGDEFCIVMKNCSSETARERLIQIHEDFANDQTHTYEKSFSFGIIQLPNSHDSITIDQMIEEADRAMYVQKRAHHQERV